MSRQAESLIGLKQSLVKTQAMATKILTGNQLEQLANVHEMPVVQVSFNDEHLKNIIQYFSIDPDEFEKELHQYAAQLL